jgi:hypothetical protein
MTKEHLRLAGPGQNLMMYWAPERAQQLRSASARLCCSMTPGKWTFPALVGTRDVALPRRAGAGPTLRLPRAPRYADLHAHGTIIITTRPKRKNFFLYLHHCSYMDNYFNLYFWRVKRRSLSH